MKHLFATFMITSAASASGQWLTDSLIAHFPMDGTPDDMIGVLVPVVSSGTPAFCADRHGAANGAACFDGSSFWSYGDVLDVDTDMYSIALWCRIDGLTFNDPNHDYPLSKGTTVSGTPPLSGYSFGFRDEFPDTLSAAALFGNSNQALLIKDHPVTYGVWNHYTISRCADDQVAFYINANLVAMDTLAFQRNLSTNIHFSIGAGSRAPVTGPGGYFQGAVDDLCFYKGRCLTDSEILTLSDFNVAVGERSASANALHLSPSPAAQNLRIDLPSPLQITGPIYALNALGQQVTLRTLNLTMVNDAVKSISVDVSQLPEGAYFVVVPTEKGRMHGRFVKE